tara:strand:+ start:153 stop:920 length:768 start_codon:yes stop_codon:yes gene_type:complete
MSTLYWCEFPEECDWKKLGRWLDSDTMTIYVTSSSRKEFNDWVKRIHKYAPTVRLGVWPILSKEEGYWFSSFTSKKSIDILEEFRGLDMKIDIEPPIPKNDYSLMTAFSWLVFNYFKGGDNRKYLQDKILSLSKDAKVIVSGFPLPKFILKRGGWVSGDNIKHNYMLYTSFFPKILRGIYRWKYKFFIKMNKDAYFAVGLIGVGIFRNEPSYEKIEEMKKDIEFLKKNNVKNFVIFRIGAILERGKEWLDETISL